MFHDWKDGGAWPFLVGGMICQLDCDNERDLEVFLCFCSLEGKERKTDCGRKSEEVPGNNRSVMPFDVAGSTRATMEVTVRDCSERKN